MSKSLVYEYPRNVKTIGLQIPRSKTEAFYFISGTTQEQQTPVRTRKAGYLTGL